MTEMDFVQELIGKGVSPLIPWMGQYFSEIKRRELWITDEIDDDSIDIVKKIHEWNREDLVDTSITYSSTPRKPIRIYFNSIGGNLEMSLAIANAIKNSKTHILGHNIGVCASGAALIYSQCHVRTAAETSSFLIHKGGVDSGFMTYQQNKQSQTHYDRLVNSMMDLLYEKFDEVEITRDEFEKMADSEWYLYPSHENKNQDALRLGLITG